MIVETKKQQRNGHNMEHKMKQNKVRWTKTV